MKKITNFYVYVYLLIIEKKKYKELELNKLEFHITRNSSMGSSSTIEEEKRAIRSSFVFTKNSSLVSSSIVLHGTQVYQAWVPYGIFSIKNPHQHKFFFMKFKCLKLNLQGKLEFQKVVFYYLFCKQWYVANNFRDKWQMANLAPQWFILVIFISFRKIYLFYFIGNAYCFGLYLKFI